MIVDHQAHWYSPRYFEWACDPRPGLPLVSRHPDGGYVFEEVPGKAFHVRRNFYDLDVQLADMDQHRVDVSVISPNMLCDVTDLDHAVALQVIRLLNEEAAGAQERHPSRIVGLAVLPMHDVATDLEVLDEAIRQLNLAGVCLLTSSHGRPLVTPERLPLFSRIAELGIPMFLHPSRQSLAHDVMPDPAIEMGLAWMFDTAATALSLVYTGVLDACPDLTVVHPHLGGVVPFIRGRVVQCEIGHSVNRELDEYLRDNFYVDSVGATPGALAMAAQTYGLDHILYSTDFPWLERETSNRYVEANLDRTGQRQVREFNRIPNLRLPSR